MQLLFIPSACFLEKDIISISHFTRPNPAPCVYTAVWTLSSLAPKPFPMHKQECSAMYIPLYTHENKSSQLPNVILGGGGSKLNSEKILVCIRTIRTTKWFLHTFPMYKAKAMYIPYTQ